MTDIGGSPSPAPAPQKKCINLALQGGGAHGAFTWGVLDHLLADGRLHFEGISGTAAGAMNAVLLADGLVRGGPPEARKRLAEFWRAASSEGALSTAEQQIMGRLRAFMALENTAMAVWFDALSRDLSSDTVNPVKINPLKNVIERLVDFEAVRGCKDLQLFLSATNILTGRLRVFPRDKINSDAVMASTCLPFLFQPVEIDGVPYWDGSFLANPAIFPFFSTTETEDVLIVQLNPLERRNTPATSHDIVYRVHEIILNASLMSECRAIDFVSRLIEQQRLPRGTGPGQYRLIKLHRILLESPGDIPPADSKFSTDFEFYTQMRDGGRNAAMRFLDAHFDDINLRSTVDLSAETHAEWA